MKILEHLNLPSPVTTIETPWTKKHNLHLSLKRDDLIHPLISGNKWRKLEGILSSHPKEKVTSLVTYGGAFSNHLVATAVTASILQLPCTGVVRGERPKNSNVILSLCELYGMKLNFVSREEYKSVNRKSGLENNTLFIPEGGACVEGTIGCKKIVAELDLNSYNNVFISCGTGTTIAGIAKYFTENHISLEKIVGVQVLKGEDYITSELEKLHGLRGVNILDEFHFGGYAKTTPELIDFIKQFTQETGVLLDPIYTGKMIYAIKALAENGSLNNKHVVAIHTGGLTGWFGKYTEL